MQRDLKRYTFTPWFVLIIIGIAVVAAPFVRTYLQSKKSRTRSALVPDWIQNSTPKENFKRDIETICQDETYDGPTFGFETLAPHGFSDSSSGRVSCRLTRVLETSHIFETSLALQFHRNDEAVEIRLNSIRDPGDTLVHLVELRGREIRRVQAGSQQYGPNQLRPELLSSLPIGIGDLQLGDVLAFYNVLREGTLKPIGYLKPFGMARKQLVLEAIFPPTPAHETNADAANAHEEKADLYQGWGASALVYVDQERLTIQRLLIFDDEDRLVRIYEDFLYDESDKSSKQIRGFRAASMVAKSHSVFHVDRIDIKR